MNLKAGLLVLVGAMTLLGGSMQISSCNRIHARVEFTRVFDISPGEDQVVFSGTGQGEKDIYLLQLKNQRVSRLTESEAYESAPSFSPDGKFVTYAAGENERADHIFIRSLDGRTSKQLTFDDYNDRAPSFSPDGKTIVFVRDQSYITGGLMEWGTWRNSKLYSVNTDGTHLQALTDVAASDTDWPRFSPDGKRIVVSYYSQQGLDIGKVAAKRPPGKKQVVSIQPLTSDETNTFPVFLLDNRHIAFFKLHRDKGREKDGLYQVDLSGYQVRRLIRFDETLEKNYGSFVLSRDGKNVYFLADSTGQLKRIGIGESTSVKIADASLIKYPLQWLKPAEAGAETPLRP